jgi:hypothetical protein
LWPSRIFCMDQEIFILHYHHQDIEWVLDQLLMIDFLED